MGVNMVEKNNEVSLFVQTMDIGPPSRSGGCHASRRLVRITRPTQ